MGISSKEECAESYPQILHELKDGNSLQAYPHFADCDIELSLEGVLEKYENDAVAMASMTKGVELIQNVRENFYNEVVSYWVN